MTDWPAVPLETLVEPTTPITYGIVKPSDDDPNGVLMVRGGDIKAGTVLLNQLRKVPQALSAQYKRTILKGGEIVVSLVGAPGEVAIVPAVLRGANVNRAVGLVRPKTGVDTRFLAYYLRSPVGQAHLRGMSRGSVQQVINLNDLKQVPVPRPQPGIQKEIGNVLGSLDDKIELNLRTNETLDAMAQTIFRDWFVAFGPVHQKLAGAVDPVEIMGGLTFDVSHARSLAALFPGEMSAEGVPMDWTTTGLDEYANLNPESWSGRTAPAEIRYVDLSNTKWGMIESAASMAWKDAPSRARRIVRAGDTLVGTVRPGNGSYAFVGEEGLTASTGFAHLRPKQRIFEDFIYIAATRPENIERLSALADGAAYPAVNPSVVVATQVPRLTPLVADGFASLVSPLRGLIEQRKRENKTLAEVRDYLLPRLMSGEVAVADALRSPDHE